MNTYIVKVDNHSSNEIKDYTIYADSLTGAAFRAGVLAGRDGRAPFDSLEIVWVKQLIQKEETVWSAE